MTEARARIAELLVAALADADAPAPPPVRARELAPTTQRTQRRRRGRDARARRATAVERLEAAASRGAATAGDAYRPPPRMPRRAWAIAQAIVRDTSGVTARTALTTLPLSVRHRAAAAIGDARTLAARYRAALLIGLYQASRPSRSRRRPGRVVDGFSRAALCSLVRSPADNHRLSVSRVYGRQIHGAPLMPWLIDAGLLSREQPGRGARGVFRGPSGWALSVYYLPDDAAPASALTPHPARRAPASRPSTHDTHSQWLADLLRPPD